ncbi:hypothetical protein C7959_13044 [Orenia marismortui]|uniref:Uncharacterized protein n=1 Tax=Orenia marismortui TaxID=46469 RepID=A0A4R8H042_9FIRM|nr:hypothetical protein C7959_13044 [Orenia marismortui]
MIADDLFFIIEHLTILGLISIFIKFISGAEGNELKRKSIIGGSILLISILAVIYLF